MVLKVRLCSGKIVLRFAFIFMPGIQTVYALDQTKHALLRGSHNDLVIHIDKKFFTSTSLRFPNIIGLTHVSNGS